jgi:hypothetical protein
VVAAAYAATLCMIASVAQNVVIHVQENGENWIVQSAVRGDESELVSASDSDPDGRSSACMKG